MRIGYARVSSLHQNLDRQIGALRAERIDKLFTEKASGKTTKDRPQLEKAIDLLGAGDTLVVAEWDRATRSMMDGIKIIERIHARGAFLKCWTSRTSISPRPSGEASSRSCPRWPRTSASASPGVRTTAGRRPRAAAYTWAGSPS